jgi:hypothetical protein
MENIENAIRICPKCGIEYENSAKFCRNCGHGLVLMQCCGEVFRKNEDGSFDKYCMKCGKLNPLEQAKQALAEEVRKKAEELRIAAEKSKAKESSKGTKWPVIMTAAVLLCIGTGIFIWNKAINESTGSSSQNQTSPVTVNKNLPVHQHHPLVSPDSATVKKNYSVGDTIKFGSYPYSENGEEEEIEWQILDKYADGTALVVSKYALDNVKYNEKDESVTWETCTIWKWLNHDFYNIAFWNANKNLIVVSYLENKDNTKWNTKGGNNTYDKLFLLSIEEAEKYFKSDDDREAYPTPYAKARGAHTNADLGGSCWWWLRSPGSAQDIAAHVNSDGDVDSFGTDVNYDIAVRVALKINLNNL